MFEKTTLAVVAEYATLTGSSVIPGVEPRDIDYVALYDFDRVQELRELGAHPIRDESDSFCSEWGTQTRLTFKHGDKNVEVIFVEKEYFAAMQIYTGLLKNLSVDPILRGILSVKEVRVLIAETVRATLIKLGHCKTGVNPTVSEGRTKKEFP